MNAIREPRIYTGPRVVGGRPTRVSDAELEELRAWNDRHYPAGIQRPQTRRDCEPGGHNAERPCGFAACRHHLAVYLSNGNVRLSFPDGAEDFSDLEHTCALDVAAEGEHRQERIGELLNVTKSRSQQMEVRGLRRLELYTHLTSPISEPEWVEPPKVQAPAPQSDADAEPADTRPPLVCSDCGAEFPRRAPGTAGRQRSRCEKCWAPHGRRRQRRGAP